MPRFSEIHGQEPAIELLRQTAARGRTPHAYLFEGSPGVGKTSAAFALAQYLNCEAPTAVDSCGTCSSCGKFMRMTHFDVHWVFPMPGTIQGKTQKQEQRSKLINETRRERATIRKKGEGPPPVARWGFKESATISIGRDADSFPGSIRELRQEAYKKPVEARLKLFVVSDADRMKAEAANSLLKVLEEPPPGNLLVLTSANPGALLTTILSRCQSVRFRNLGEQEIARQLLERTGTDDPARANLAAALARGSLTRAAELAGEDVVADRDQAIALMDLVPGDPRVHAMTKALGGGAKNRIPVQRMLDFSLVWLSDVLRVETDSGVPLANGDREAQLRAHAARFGLDGIRTRKEALAEAKRAMMGNVSLEMLLHRLVVDMNEGATVERAAL